MRLRQHLISASSQIFDLTLRSRAELLTSLLIVRGFAILSLFIMIKVLNPEDDVDVIMIVASFINLVAYGISRTRHFEWGAFIIIVEPLLGVPCGVLSTQSAPAITTGPIWLGLGPVVSSLVLTTRSTFITILLTAIPFLLMIFVLPQESASIVAVQFLFVMSISGLALIGTYLRDKMNKALQEERAKMQQISKLSALGEMAGGIAHELNTPLGAIILNMGLIEEKVQTVPNADKDVISRINAVVSIAERMSKIIAGLKLFSRNAKSDSFERVVMKKVIQDTLDLCQQRFKANGVNLIVKDAFLETPIEVQPIQLSQVLLNLLNNSFDAIRDQPEKWIQIEVLPLDQGFLSINVTDSGKGIPKTVEEKLFQPFFTTKEIGKGTGLGLSISRGIIQGFGGHLFYDQTSPNTKFVIQLPLPLNQEESAS